MSSSPAVPDASRRPGNGLTFTWWAILCLVGLDYFSSLAYLPSIAMHHVGNLAPIAGVGVVLITLLAALPVYFYVVGRSPNGKGGIGLLEQCTHGWRGKLLVLALLGFIGTDFVLTRSLSVSDAAMHILGNPLFQERAEWVSGNREIVRSWFPAFLQGGFFDFWNEQLVLSLALSILAFGLYFYLVKRLSQGFVGVVVAVVVLYLLVNVVVIASGLIYLVRDPALIHRWEVALRPEVGDLRQATGGVVAFLALLGLLYFPPMAIGLSGFELSMATAPMVRGHASDTPAHPRIRMRNTRLVMIVSAVVMSALVLGATLVTSLLLPRTVLGVGPVVQHRALAYLAHGETLINGHPGLVVNPVFGMAFGTLYDLSTVMILCLAGASATISLRDLIPDFMARFGMQMEWAHRIGVIMHLFNGVILLVTVVFKASVSAQLWAYAASVLALLFGASLAASLDVKRRWPGTIFRWVLQIPFTIITILFALMLIVVVVQKAAGVAIALLFVAVVLVTAIVSRWLRSTEMRFIGFAFADQETEQRWAEVCRLEFQVLVPHSPRHETLESKEREIRQDHRLATEVPIIFIEVHLGDPSDFYQQPVMKIDRAGEAEVIRVTRCTSIAHVVAAIALAFREVGRPPEIHFNWSDEAPMAANLSFLLLGEGNVPWMVHALLRKAERDPGRRPRVVVG